MDEISQEPKWDFRLPPGRWVAVVASIAMGAVVTAVAAAVALTDGGGHHGAVPPKGQAALAVPAPTPAPGTVLLTCDSAAFGPLGPHWQARSLRAGPLWFAYGRQQGYVHDDGWAGTSSLIRRPGRRHTGVMIVDVKAGSTVIMKPAAAARPYFHFVDGFGLGADNDMPAGDTGFTFAACPHGSPNGQVTDFYLGFSMPEGRAAPVDVWPSARSRPMRVIFTCPGRGCEG